MTATSERGTVYELHGPSDAPVVALIHGLGLTRATWRQFIAPLSRNYRVLTYDLLGHGESALPTGTPMLTSYSEQLHDLIGELQTGPVAAVGFSLGGMINRRLAMDHAEAVTCLAILNSPHERGPEAQIAVERRARDSSAGGPSANIEATLERWFTQGFRDEHPDVVSEIKHWVLANDPKTYAECRFVLANGVVELIRPDIDITCPTLVMTCEHDSGSTPQMARAIAKEIPGSNTVIVQGLQHLGLIEQPKRFLQPVQEFLAENLAR